MKVCFTLLLLTSFLITNSQTFSQDTNSAKFFPLKIGNSWTYYESSLYFVPYYKRVIVTKDSVISNHKYYYLSGLFNWIRYDSTNGNLLMHAPNQGCSGYQNDRIIDSLASSVNNVVNCLGPKTCNGITTQNVFSITTQVKTFTFNGVTYGGTNYAKNIGRISSCSGEPPPCIFFSELRGCIINGIIYGDTTVTAINQNSNTIPEKYFLSQNYPNPFNPTTKIRFQVPVNSFVTLVVYDVLGKNVQSLVNEHLQQGNYDFNWNAENFPSGIYYYKLTSESFSETKKMILLK